MNDLAQKMTLADLMRNRAQATHTAMPESKRTLADLMRGGLMGVTTDVLGAPVDLATMMMRPFGYQHQKPVGGSDWLAEKLTRPTGSKEETGARFLSGLLSPDVGDLMKLAPLMAGMTVFHGSPHKFDRFDLSKIGAGEGAQAYGHGLYFADNPKVAKYYTTAGPEGAFPHVYKDGYRPSDSLRESQNIADNVFMSQLAMDLPRNTVIGDKELAKLRESLAHHADLNAGGPRGKYYDEALQRFDELSAKVKGGKLDYEPGHLYTVDLPDEAIAKMLDWDNTIPEPQREQLSKAMVEKFGSGASSSQGESVWKSLVWEFKNAGSKTPEHDASRFLKEIGIPGIRYLDGGSRSAGKGTSNYVVFDDSLLKILKRE